jgi:hypothetical protein
LIRETEKWSDIAIGTMAAILSMYSMAGGVISDLILLVMYGFLTAVRVCSSKNYERHGGYYFCAAFVLGFLGAAILFWLSGYSKPPYHPALVLPYESKFWSYFLNIVAFGFGIDQVSNILGVFCLFVVVLPVVGSAAIYGQSLPVGLWRSITFDLGSARSFGIGVQWTSWFWYWAVKGIPLLRTCDALAAIMRLQLDFLSAGEEVFNGSGTRKLVDYFLYGILEQLAPV